MKIERFELRRFGHFSDEIVDLAGAGLQVVYGPNEAGKSTIFDAIRYTLYGMPVGRSTDPKYDFVHRMSALRTAMRIRLDDGECIEFARSRGATPVRDYVSDDPDQALAARLDRALQGIPLDRWRREYSLTEAQIRAQTHEWIRGQRDGRSTGEAMFQVAAGMTQATRVLEQIRAEMWALLKDTGQSGLLASSLAAWDAAAKRVSTARIEVSRYDELVSRRDRLRVEQRAARLQIAEREERARLLDACAAAHGLLQRIAALSTSDEREVIAAGSWTRDLHEAFTAARSTRAESIRQIAQLDVQIEALRTRAAALRLDESVHAVADVCRDLNTRLSQFRDAQKVLPAAREAVAKCERERAAVLVHVGWADRPVEEVVAELPSEVDRDSIKREASRRLELERAVVAATAELAATREIVEELAGAAGAADSSESGDDRSITDDVLDALQANRAAAAAVNVEAIAQALSSCESRRADLEVRARRLPGGSVDLQGVQEMKLPTQAARVRLEQEFEDRRQRIETVRATQSMAETKIESRSAELAELTAGAVVPDPATLASLRHERDAQWSPLRSIILGQTPAGPDAAESVHGFEQHMVAADSYADQLADDAARVGKASVIRAEITADEQRRDDAQRELEDLARDLEVIEAEWNALWQPSGLPVGNVAEMAELSETIERLRVDAADLAASEQALAAQMLAVRGHVSQYAALLGVAVPDASRNEDLLAALSQLDEQAARVIVESEQRRRRLTEQRGKLAERRNDLRRRTAALDAARQACAEHDQAWRSATSTAGCAEQIPPDAVVQRVERFAELATLIDTERAARAHEAQLLATIEQFTSDVAAAASAAGRSAAHLLDLPADVTLRRLQELVDQDSRARVEADGLQERITLAQTERAELSGAQAGAEASLDALVADAGCTSVEELDAVDEQWHQSERRAAEARELSSQVVAETRFTVDELRDTIDGRSPAEVRLEREELAQQLADIQQAQQGADEQVEQLVQDIAVLEHRSDQSDALNDLHVARAQIEQQVPGYRQRALQYHMLKQLIDQRTQQDVGPIIRLASDYFSRMTCGAFDRVELDIDESGQHVVEVERRDGSGRVSEGELSEGTLQQLYLALRLARLVTAASTSGQSIPIVLDDVLPSFDNERAAATMQLLAEIGQQMQIIFLTHHKHVVDMTDVLVADGACALHLLGTTVAAT